MPNVDTTRDLSVTRAKAKKNKRLGWCHLLNKQK